MLEGISQAFQDIARTIAGTRSITAKNIQDSVEKIKLALLDADVNLRVVRRFINSTLEEATGEAVLRAVSPGQQFTKIIHDKLTALLGDKRQELQLKGKDTLSVVLFVGLQGSGKTTTTAKLARVLKESGRKVLLAACDLQRLAAVEQLETLAAGIDVGFFKNSNSQDPVAVAHAAVQHAKRELYDTCIIDTAGRLTLDEELMAQLVRIRDAVKPTETLLVADAMTGQSAADVAKGFDDAVGLTGVILSKFDSDTRGGAALSIKSVTGKPIKFIGVSEHLDGLEPFYPERLAGRILGMGDIVTLVEKAQAVMDQKEAEVLEKKISKEGFTLEDYLKQIRSMKKMGSVKNLLEMMPGLAGQLDENSIDEGRLKRIEAILTSMTPKERKNHLILGPRRRSRIAKGSGTSVAEVNQLVRKFEKSRTMLKKVAKDKRYQAQLFGSP